MAKKIRKNVNTKKVVYRGIAVGMAAVMGGVPVSAAAADVSKEETDYVNADAYGNTTDDTVTNYRMRWRLAEGAHPTSDLPTHQMNHEVKKKLTNGKHRVIYHAHTTNTIALTFVLPLDDKVFTRELWESATECPVVFQNGVGVIGWMVPGGRDIAVKTAELMKKYDVVIWAHHGMFCSGEDFDLTFGLLHTVEKSAEILVKILSMTPKKLQTITPDNFRSLAKDFKVSLPEEFLYEKQ